MVNILIADDSAFMRSMLKKIITEAGHSIIGEADNGYNAVELYEKLKPDITFLDITMPVMDGIEALKLIKMINENAKVVICSSMGQEFHMSQAMNNGAETFIVKPFQPMDVINTIKKIIS